MKTLLARRLLFLVPVLFGILVAVFVTMRVVPGDPARLVAGADAGPEELATIRAQFGLDQPLHVQFGMYLRDVTRGEFGRSLKTQRPVIDEIRPRLINTVILAVLSTAFATVVGLGAGVAAAARRHSRFDYATMAVAMLGVSTPPFYLGIVLIVVFAVILRWLPSGGAGGVGHLVLPAVTLGASTLGIVARMTRASMLEVFNEDYVRTARAKGVAESSVIGRHALRNALLPVITIIGIEFAFLMGGLVVTEQVFNLNGLGRLLVQAVTLNDYTLTQAIVMIIVLVFVFTNFLVDILYAWLDPRVRYD